MYEESVLSHQTEVGDVEAVKIILASNNAKTRSGFIAAAIAALLIAFSPNLYAQSSPLTIQTSTASRRRNELPRSKLPGINP